MKDKFEKAKTWQQILIIVLIALFVEVFTFNIRFFTTLNNKETLILSDKYADKKGNITIKNIDKHISNIEIVLDKECG